MPGLAPYIRTLAASERTTINVRGTTIFVRRTTETLLVTARSTQVGQGDGGGQGVTYTIRMAESEKWFTAEEFDSVEIENTGDNSAEIEVYIGVGDFFRPVPDIVNVQVTSAESETVTTEADETAINVGNAGSVQLLPADANRVFAIITALAGNGDTIRIGDSNVDSARGTPLAAGETIKWTSKAACYACAEATAGQGAAKSIYSVG